MSVTHSLRTATQGCPMSRFVQKSETAAQAGELTTAQPAKGELGSKDAVTATAAGDSLDDAASHPPSKQQLTAEAVSKGSPQRSSKEAGADPPEPSQSPAAAKESEVISKQPAKAADFPLPTTKEAAATASVTGQTPDADNQKSAVQSKQEAPALKAAAAEDVSSEHAKKSSEGFTFGSALASKTPSSGFGALAGTQLFASRIDLCRLKL